MKKTNRRITRSKKTRTRKGKHISYGGGGAGSIMQSPSPEPSAPPEPSASSESSASSEQENNNYDKYRKDAINLATQIKKNSLVISNNFNYEGSYSYNRYSALNIIFFDGKAIDSDYVYKLADRPIPIPKGFEVMRQEQARLIVGYLNFTFIMETLDSKIDTICNEESETDAGIELKYLINKYIKDFFTEINKLIKSNTKFNDTTKTEKHIKDNIKYFIETYKNNSEQYKKCENFISALALGKALSLSANKAKNKSTQVKELQTNSLPLQTNSLPLQTNSLPVAQAYSVPVAQAQAYSVPVSPKSEEEVRPAKHIQAAASRKQALTQARPAEPTYRLPNAPTYTPVVRRQEKNKGKEERKLSANNGR